MAEFSFRSELSLKNIAAIFIAEALWKSSEVKNEINMLSTGKKPEPKQIKERRWRYLKPLAFIDDHENYCRWEKMIDVVREKVNLLSLPFTLKSHLQKLVILLGEKIYYFDNQYKVDEAGVVSHQECSHSGICDFSFSHHGIMWANCPALHFKNNFPNDEILEKLPQMCLNTYPAEFRHFAKKLRSMNDQSLFSDMVKLVMKYELSDNINSRLHFYPYPDFKPEKILFLLNLIAPDKKSVFIEKNLDDLFMCFLPVWPFQELVPQLLDLCLKENLKLNHRRLLLIILFCIEMDNESRYQLRKQFYLDIFEKVWLSTPNDIRVWILFYKFRSLVIWKPNIEILKMAVTTEDLKKCVNIEDITDDLNPTLCLKCLEVVEDNNYEFVKALIDGLVPLPEDIHGFVCCYLYGKLTK